MQKSTAYSETVQTALKVLFGGDAGMVFVDEPPAGSDRCNIVIADSPRVPQLLASHGYRFSHRFALLPSKEKTRWLVPRSEDSLKASGLEMYPSFSIRASLYKTYASRMAKMGWPGWSANVLWVASKNRFPIDKLVEEITGESQPQFALSLGTAVASRKLTIQVMRRTGDILGYIKLPLTDQANSRIHNEARMLERANGNPRLRKFVPTVLHASEWNSGYILFQNLLSGDRGPIRLAACHERVFDAMHSEHAGSKLGAQIVGDVGTATAPLKRLGSKWECLAADALHVAAHTLSGAKVQCGLGHGDFAPWNTRIDAGELRVFDWEMASCDVPFIWDKFHFLAQTQSLLRRGNGVEVAELTNEERGLYVLYLLQSTANLVEDAGNAHDIEYRRGELQSQVEVLARNQGNMHLERREARIAV